MLQNLYLAFDAVFPFFVYLAAGAVLGRCGLLDERTGRAMNRIAFYTFFPLVIFNSLARSEISDIRWGFLGISIVILLAAALLSFFLAPLFVKENPRRGVTIQAFFRANIVLYLVTLTTELFGGGAAAEASVLLSAFTMIQNVLGVLAFELYRGGKVSVGKISLEMIRNPLIIATVAGGIFLLMGWQVPALLQKPMNTLGAMGSPSIMLALGASLKLKAFRKNALLILLVLGIRMLLTPFLLFLFGGSLGLLPAELFILIIVFASPVANNIYVMALTMDGDTELAGQMVVLSTVASLGTVFLWIYISRVTGIIA